MFWGLIMEPKRRYFQEVSRPFHISMASMDITACTKEPVQLMAQFQNRNYLLCTLQKGGQLQVPLDLNFEVGDEVAFTINGQSHVHLSGYHLQDEYGESGESDDDEEEEKEQGKEQELVKVENKETEEEVEEKDVSLSNIVYGKRKQLKTSATNLTQRESTGLAEMLSSDWNALQTGPAAKRSKTLEMLNEICGSEGEDDDEDDEDVTFSDLDEDDDSDDDGLTTLDSVDDDALERESDEDDSDVDQEEDEGEDEEDEDEDEQEFEFIQEEEEEEEDVSEEEIEKQLVQKKLSKKEKQPLKQQSLNQSQQQKSPDQQKKNKKQKEQQKQQQQQQKPQANGIPTSEKKKKAKNKKNKQDQNASVTSELNVSANIGKPEQPKTPKSEKKQQNQQGSPQKTFVDRGVSIQEIVAGKGNPAKNGKLAHVYYEGRLKSSNKLFDNCLKGPPFKFRLGNSEVIKGWDVGVAGMKVGGKRRITVPAQMGYGVKGNKPAIPPNATLIFDIELKNVT